MAITREPIPDFTQLTDDQILSVGEHLRDFQAHPAYDIWLQLLQSFLTGALEQMSEAQELKELFFWQGVVHALKEIRKRPATLVAAAKAIREAEEEAKKAAESGQAALIAADARQRLSGENDMSD